MEKEPSVYLTEQFAALVAQWAHFEQLLLTALCAAIADSGADAIISNSDICETIRVWRRKDDEIKKLCFRLTVQADGQLILLSVLKGETYLLHI